MLETDEGEGKCGDGDDREVVGDVRHALCGEERSEGSEEVDGDEEEGSGEEDSDDEDGEEDADEDEDQDERSGELGCDAKQMRRPPGPDVLTKLYADQAVDLTAPPMLHIDRDSGPTGDLTCTLRLRDNRHRTVQYLSVVGE